MRPVRIVPSLLRHSPDGRAPNVTAWRLLVPAAAAGEIALAETLGRKVALPRSPDWRMRVALSLWVVGFLPPLLIPTVLGSALSATSKGVVACLLVVGLPQLLTAIAVAALGRQRLRGYGIQISGLLKQWSGRPGTGPTRQCGNMCVLEPNALTPVGLRMLEPNECQYDAGVPDPNRAKLQAWARRSWSGRRN
jgi:hypothetical protein